MTPRNRLTCVSTAIASAGLGNITIGAAVAGFKAFTAADNGLTFTLLILSADGASWEVRRECTYTHSTKVLTRGTIEETSNSNNSAVTFSVGATVSVIFSAGDTGLVQPATLSAPTGVVAVGGDGQVSATWAAPSNTGGNPITNYLLEWSGGQVATVGNVLSGIVMGILNGASGTMQVSASNNGGVSYGPASVPSNSVTPAGSTATVPSAPTSLVAFADHKQVRGVWVAPSNDGGSPILGYRLTFNGGTPVEVAAVTTGFVYNLPNFVTGTLVVEARNEIGYGPASTASAPVTPVPIKAGEVAFSKLLGSPSAGITNTNGFKEFNTARLLYNTHQPIAINNIRLRFVNAHIHAGGNGTMVPAPRMTLRVGVSVPNNLTGARVLVTFNGGNSSVTLEPGQGVWSDPIVFSEGLTTGGIRCVCNMVYETAPPMLPLINFNSTNNTHELSEGAVSGLAAKHLSGMPTTRISSKLLYGPCAAVGIPSSTTTKVRIGVTGDSITSGASDVNTGSLVGFAQKGVDPTGFIYQFASTEGYAYVNMPRGSNARRFTMEAMFGCSHVISFLNVNDIRSGQSTAQIRGHMTTFKEDLASELGVNKFIVATCFTNTNSTNNGEASTGLWARLNAHNTAIIANNGVGDGYFDLNAQTRSSSNSNIWDTTGGTPHADGTHPYAWLHTKIATALTTYLNTLTV